MIYRSLGDSNLKVSALCPGTLTYGEQNSEAEAYTRFDRAIDAGINFIDTAKMYPVPHCAETQGGDQAPCGPLVRPPRTT